MRTKPALTADDCKTIAAAAEAEARRNGWAVAIAILDDGAHLLHLHRMDGASPHTADISQRKARTSALTRKPSKGYEDRIAAGRNSVLSMPFVSIQGGLPIMVEGECVGAIGVSGRESDEDEHIARAGIEALFRR